MKNFITFEFYIRMQKLPFIRILALKKNFSFDMKCTNIALKHKDVTVGHLPKLLSKITHFYLKHDGDLLVKIMIGKKQFSKDLPQEGKELPALYIFNSRNLVMH